VVWALHCCFFLLFGQRRSERKRRSKEKRRGKGREQMRKEGKFRGEGKQNKICEVENSWLRKADQFECIVGMKRAT
jgi:hypothetical protein